MKNLKFLIAATVFSSLYASEVEFNITHITPLKEGMGQEEAENAIKSFLKNEILKPENYISHLDISEQTTYQTNGIGRQFTVVILTDGSKWVLSGDGLQRLIGAVYLEKAIEAHKLDHWQVVETKFFMPKPESPFQITINNSDKEPLKGILTINSPHFYTLSRYVGDQKPQTFSLELELEKHRLTTLTGFSDLSLNANLRTQPDLDKTIVIDTEYRSFSVDEKISSSAQDSELGGLTFTYGIKELLNIN